MDQKLKPKPGIKHKGHLPQSANSFKLPHINRAMGRVIDTQNVEKAFFTQKEAKLLNDLLLEYAKVHKEDRELLYGLAKKILHATQS